MKSSDVKTALQELANPARAKSSAWFFKTGPGEYGEGDQFIGVTVPDQRRVAKTYRELPLPEVLTLLRSPIHEHRLTALFILIEQYRRGDNSAKKQIAGLYHKNRQYVNNWDLVDSSAPYILGDYLTTHSPTVLFRLAASKSLWDRRIAVIATFVWLKLGQCEMTLQLAAILVDDKEDLIQKAVGWALREVGKRDVALLLEFLDQQAATMPRTALRYAIERLTPDQKEYYLYAKNR